MLSLIILIAPVIILKLRNLNYRLSMQLQAKKRRL